MKKSGFAIIELIITMLVMAISLTPFSILIANALQQNVYSFAQGTAVALAEGEMERVTNQRFSLTVNEAATAFSAPFTNYTHQVIVDYVNSGALNTVVAGPTDYKRVRVIVNSAISGANTLTTLVANDW